MQGRVPNDRAGLPSARAAAVAVHRWLGMIATYHRGALCHRYTPRPWPRELVARYGPLAGVVVRLECSVYPWDGHSTTEQLEEAAVQRLLDALTRRKRGTIATFLPQRARLYVREAILAYVAVRGDGPCILPPYSVTAPPATEEDAAQ
jgi:hypothetical protein